MKKVFCVLATFVLIAFSCVEAFAAGINSNEQSVLNQMNTPANMQGNLVYVPASYVNQAEAHFNTIDMTKKQANEINSLISQGRSFLESTGKKSISELTGAEKKKLIQYASAAAGVLNLTAVGGSDTSRVKIIGKDGEVIIDDSGSVIKTTGQTAPSFSLDFDIFVAAAGIIAIISIGAITIIKTRNLVLNDE
ncbi:MAG: hypothetical protein ACI4HO_10220 [Ruminococcus sp.]